MKNLSFIKIVRFLITLMSLLLLYSQVAISAEDSTTVMQIFKFDNDCLPDTLIGRKIHNGHKTRVIPLSIRWGWGECNDNIPSTGYRETLLKFPAWNSLSVMTFHDKMNNDAVDDLVLRVRGKVRLNVDTARFVVIFGQQGLKQLPILDLSLIDTNANMPLIVRELQKGKQLVEPQKHDMSGGNLWKIQRFDIAIENYGDSYLKSGGNIFSVSPNPATLFTDIQSLESMPAGMYDVEVYGSNAQRVIKQSITLQQNGDLRTRLDLHSLFSGYYTIRVYSGSRKIAEFLFIIIR